MSSDSQRSDSREPPPDILKFRPADLPELSLSDCYRRYLWPQHKQFRSAATISTYKTTLKLWRQLSGNPPVWEINDAVWVRFRDRAKPGRSWQTLKKYRRCVRAILHAAAKSDDAALVRVPWLSTIDEPPGRRLRFVPPETVSAIFDAAAGAVYPWRPGKLPAPLWWRGFLVCLWNFGLRSESELLALTWDCFFDAERCPLDYAASNRYGWLVTPTPKTRRFKSELVLPVGRVPRAMLELLRRHAGAFQRRLFPTSSGNGWREEFRRLQALAGLSEPFYQPHDLRATCGAAYDQVDFGLGRYVLGHAPRDTNERFYQQPLLRLVSACDQIEQPAAFTRFLESEGAL